MTFDVMHFEVLGKERDYLIEETNSLISKGVLPNDFKSLFTPLTLQDYLKDNDEILPNIITIKTHSIIPEEYISSEPRKSIITRSAGYDHLENIQEYVNIASLREYCVDAVAQTAIKFVFTTLGNLNEYTYNAQTFERNKTDSFIEINNNRVATVFGVGKIGSRIYEILEKIGFTVQAVDIRQEELKNDNKYKNFKFVDKEMAIKNSDVIINAMNFTKNKNSKFYNENYFNEDYLRKANNKIVFINVTRGEIAPESILLKLYKEGLIIGLGLDVFSRESVLTECLTEDRKLDTENLKAAYEIIDKAQNRTSNFYVQPHQGFNSDLAASAKAHEAIEHLKYWYQNGQNTFKEQLPYYSEK